MLDFVMAALPWVCLGLSIALWAAPWHHTQPDTNGHTTTEDHRTEGLCLGACFGLLFGVNYISYGMLAGTVVGMLLPKAKKNDTNNTNEEKQA